MPVNNFIPSTAGGACGNLPVKSASACAREKVLREIDMIYFSRDPFTNDPEAANALWLTEFASRLSNTSTTTSPAPIRFKEVYAELPDSTPDTVKDEFGNVFQKKNSRTITFTDSDLSTENHTWHRNAQNLGNIRMWYCIGGHLYGGKTGIDATFYSVFSSTQSGDSIPNKYSCVFSFDEIGIPPRVARP